MRLLLPKDLLLLLLILLVYLLKEQGDAFRCGVTFLLLSLDIGVFYLRLINVVELLRGDLIGVTLLLYLGIDDRGISVPFLIPTLPEYAGCIFDLLFAETLLDFASFLIGGRVALPVVLFTFLLTDFLVSCFTV